MHGSSGCPGSKAIDFTKEAKKTSAGGNIVKQESQLRQWPIQIMLVPADAPYFNDADLLIAADCTAFSYAGFHHDLLKGKILLVGCPKLDDAKFYEEKITRIFKENNIKSVACVHMEVPCCFGLVGIVKSALVNSGKSIVFKELTVGIKGQIR